MAADLTRRGYPVILCDLPQFEAVLEPIRERGGLELQGVLGEGFAPLAHVTSDVGEALTAADIILIVVPAYAQAVFAEACCTHLRPGQIVVLNPGSTGGALEFAQVLRSRGADDGVIVAETLSLPYACRKDNPTRVNVSGVKTNLPIAAYPAQRTAELLRCLEGVYHSGLAPAANVLETSLNSLNAIAHPVAMLLNTGWIEHTGGKFSFYGEGVTPSVAHAMEAVDRERMAVASALGLEPISLVQWDQRLYGLKGDTLYELIHNSWVHGKSQAPESLQSRYLTEDMPYGLVPIASIGAALGVPTPTINLFIDLACLLLGTDLRASGRTAEKLGLAGLSSEQMQAFVRDGEIAVRGVA